MPGPCHRCGRQVYSAEERLALCGQSWHQECFTCAVCNKSLDSTNLAENQENKEIYCKNCYRVLYGTKGYGYGPNEPTLLANTGPEEECCEITPSNSKTEFHQCQGGNAAVVVKPYEQIPFRKGFLYWGKHPTPRHYGHQVVNVAPRVLKKCEPAQMSQWPNISSPNPPTNATLCSKPGTQATPFSKFATQATSGPKPGTHSTQCPPNYQIMPQQRNHPKASHSTGKNHCNNGVELCARCGKPVYFAEKKYGYNGVYHIRCYICGSCGKSLESTTVNESNGILYCSGCYKRFVATGGVGYGIGAGTLQTH